MTKISIKSAIPANNNYIFYMLQGMAEESGLTDRFFLSENSLENALFSNEKFAECIIALIDDKPIGLVIFSMTNRNFDLFNGPGIYVHSLCVDKSFRRKRVGTELAQTIKDIGFERKYSRIDWVVLKDNKPAIEFYKTIQNIKEVDYINYMRITL